MDWLTLALGSALCLGFYDIAKKAALQHNAVPVVLWLSTLCSWFVLTALALSPWGAPGGPFEVHALSALQHALVAGKGLIVSSSWLLSFYGLKHLPLSIAAPIRATSPAVTVLGATLLLGERPAGLQSVGMALILTSHLAFAWLGRREGIAFERNRWVLMLVAATLLGAASGLYDKILLQRLGLPANTLQYWFTSYNAVLQGAVVAGLWRRWPSQVRGFQYRHAVLLVGLLLLVADQFYFRALAQSDALVSAISLVRRGSVMVSFLVGGWLFRELQLRAKAWPLMGILAGLALLLGSSGTP